MTETTKFTAPEITDKKKAFLLGTMVNYFEVLGCNSIKARLSGYSPPAIVTGTLQDTRPDLTCYQADREQTPLILEVVEDVNEVNIESRWELLWSACKLYKADLYFVVPEGSDIDYFKRRLMRMEMTPKQILAI